MERNEWFTGDFLPLADLEHDLRAGDPVCIRSDGGTQYRCINNIDHKKVYFNHPCDLSDLKNATLSVARRISVASATGTDSTEPLVVGLTGDFSSLIGSVVAIPSSLPLNCETSVFYPFTIQSAVYYPPYSEMDTEWQGFTKLELAGDGIDSLEIDSVKSIYLPPVSSGWSVDEYMDGRDFVDYPETFTLTIKKPKKITSGDMVFVVHERKSAMGKVKHTNPDPDRDRAVLGVERWNSRGAGNYYQSDTLLYGHFKKQERLFQYTINETPLNQILVGNRLPLPTIDLPEIFRFGRDVFLESLSDPDLSYLATVMSYDAGLLLLEPMPLNDAFTVNSTVIHGNLVTIGHGESRSSKILGSGDGTRSNQSFVVKIPGISFISDATLANGVRADVDIIVNGERWKQIGSLRGSSPTDSHYIVRMTEDGLLRVSFGDGIRGRRLPTGTDNVRFTYRSGTGSRGNLSPGSLEKPSRAHPLVDSVRQPLASGGGNDMENKASLRESAPASLLSLERAVSLQDFASMAASHCRIWQAKAFRRLPTRGRQEHINVVVVIAGGGLLSENPALKREIEDYLREHTLPNMAVSVLDYQSRLLQLNIVIRVNVSVHNPEFVKTNVIQTVAARFRLKGRNIGVPFYLSDLYQAVENVEGVENSSCSFAPSLFDGSVVAEKVRVIRPDSEDQVIHLDDSLNGLTVRWEVAP